MIKFEDLRHMSTVAREVKRVAQEEKMRKQVLPEVEATLIQAATEGEFCCQIKFESVPMATMVRQYFVGNGWREDSIKYTAKTADILTFWWAY